MISLSRSLVAASFFTLAFGQIPPNTNPATASNLAVSYGSTPVTPGIQLPLSQVASLPTITHPSSDKTYQVLVVDLSISAAMLNVSALVPGIQTPLAPGIASNRTTYLHYWQTGVTFAANGTLNRNTSPIASYKAPGPPAGDIAHAYVFYLFETGASFAPPPPGNPFSQALVDQGTNRVSFNVGKLAQETGVGPLVGATYFLAQNTTGSATGSAKPSASGTGSVSTSTAKPFTGSGNRQDLGLIGAVMTAAAFIFAILQVA